LTESTDVGFVASLTVGGDCAVSPSVSLKGALGRGFVLVLGVNGYATVAALVGSEGRVAECCSK
jgi:hypothetical protein